MEAAVDHVMDVVGVLWVVPNVGISRIMYKPRRCLQRHGTPSFLRQKKQHNNNQQNRANSTDRTHHVQINCNGN